jgi:putative transposase
VGSLHNQKEERPPMMKDTAIPAEGQVQLPETAQEFHAMLREMTRKAVLTLFEQEVSELCGPSHGRGNEREVYRAGGVESTVHIDTRKEILRRPRVRRQTATGSEEVTLKSWTLAKDPQQWEEAMYRAVLCGVSTRNVSSLREEETRGESRSNLSRLWSRKAADLVEEIQKSELTGFDIVALMIDAVVLCRDLVATVALGIDVQGSKRILGFRIGSSESSEVCSDLLRDLSGRGLSPAKDRCLLAVLDGSKALQKALTQVFPGTLVQRCLVHKERNLRRYLSKRHWAKIAELFNSLRRCQGEEAAKEKCEEITAFLSDKNLQARESFEEAAGDLLTVLRLEVPNSLNPTLLSTNAIENAFKNLRRHINRVCRWREETEQANRWVASGLHLAQRGFRKVRGYQQIPELIAALKRAKQKQEPKQAA